MGVKSKQHLGIRDYSPEEIEEDIKSHILRHLRRHGEMRLGVLNARLGSKGITFADSDPVLKKLVETGDISQEISTGHRGRSLITYLIGERG